MVRSKWPCRSRAPALNESTEDATRTVDGLQSAPRPDAFRFALKWPRCPGTRVKDARLLSRNVPRLMPASWWGLVHSLIELAHDLGEDAR
jgi:hypothetical protein